MSEDGKPRPPLRPGVYAAMVTLFDPVTEDLDIPTIRVHAVRLAQAGLVGLVALGSCGEAVHLTGEERKTVIRETRLALDEAGYQDVPIIVGASEQSVRGTVQLCRESKDAFGDYVLVTPPSYYRSTVGTEESLYGFFTSVADGSPLPVILYNYPHAVAGIDMDSDLIIRISQHPNIVGVKFTCGDTGKLTRVAEALNAITPPSPFTRTPNATESHPYMAFGGKVDFALQTLVSGGSAVIAGSANVIPRTCVHLFHLWSSGRIDEAMKLQKILSEADWVLSKGVVPRAKYAMQLSYGYGGYAREPLKRLSEESSKVVTEGIEEVMKIELSWLDDHT
ncbi:hypothetical protein V8E54_011697 [Elaphomyces granulatus]